MRATPTIQEPAAAMRWAPLTDAPTLPRTSAPIESAAEMPQRAGGLIRHRALTGSGKPWDGTFRMAFADPRIVRGSVDDAFAAAQAAVRSRNGTASDVVFDGERQGEFLLGKLQARYVSAHPSHPPSDYGIDSPARYPGEQTLTIGTEEPTMLGVVGLEKWARFAPTGASSG